MKIKNILNILSTRLYWLIWDAAVDMHKIQKYEKRASLYPMEDD